MSVSTPDWLGKRGGVVREMAASRAWIVSIDDEPQYRLTPVPAFGQYGCDLTMTVNGRRLESTGKYPTAQEAVRAALEDLRIALGW